ncbi:MAG: hypothetical protein A2340_10445 [Lentisphaerae bacterium RIFOXYB12_FULL_60_10]|nr:MAG: hypothetical protein A2340_10445 [Lentisphaerae bacterium RIFOXYB12_FULL_60_10]
MASLNDILARFRKRPVDVNGIEISSASARIVHMLKDSSGAYSLTGATTLPIPESPAPAEGTPAAPPEPLIVPPAIRGKYACLTVPANTSIIKLLNFPGHFNEQAEAKLTESIGIENPDAFRVSYKLLVEGHGKSESKVLAVALPNEDATRAVGFFPMGLPAPFSLETSTLALMTAFLHAVPLSNDEAVGLMDFGENVSSLALFNKGSVILFRRFDVGTNSLLAKIQESLGVDRETAHGIISDGSFDISQAVSDVMEPLTKQLTVSRDFVERRENCHVAKIYVSGGMTVSRDTMEEMHNAMGIEISTWDPLANITVSEGAIPEDMRNQAWMLAAAVGACIGTFEEAT